jgi:hypothetical protein
MNVRRAVVIALIAALCSVSTPTVDSRAEAGCIYPRSRITQFWDRNNCGQPVCTDVLVLVGESGVDCDGVAWSWGNTNPALHQTYRWESCPPICE